MTQSTPGTRDEAALRDVRISCAPAPYATSRTTKRATIVRRIARRMHVNGIDTLQGYLAYLRTRPGEAGALVQALLISVTNFFRDAMLLRQLCL